MMRAVSKVTGIGIINGGVRGGISVPSPSTDQSKRLVLVQRQVSNFDDWEITSGEQAPRILFSATARAFALLNENPEVQSVVASIASDRNVWDAVLRNKAVMAFLRSHKTNSEYKVVDEESFAENKLEELNSPRNYTESFENASQARNSKTFFGDMFENIKTNVVKMMSNLSLFFQNSFDFSSADKDSPAADKNFGLTMTETLGPPLFGLAIMVIVVAVLKRY